MLTNIIVRLVINALALFAAVQLVPGLQIAESESIVTSYVVLALIFGLLNAFAKPILKLLTCPLIMLTLGLFTIIINIGLFYLTSWIGAEVGYGFYIDNWVAGVLGALVVSVASFILSLILDDDDDDRARKRRRQKRQQSR